MRTTLLLLLLAGLGPLAVPAGRAQTPNDASIAYRDTVAMLVVLVRFQDDDAGACGAFWCTPDGWPHLDETGQVLPYTTLPPWADGLLEPRPTRVRADSLTLGDSTISAYFYWQSRVGPGGPHVVYGDVWPEVYVSRRPNRAYYNRRDSAGVSVRQAGGYGYLTEELLDDLTAQGLDLGRYDHDRNGVLDHLMMIVRRDSLFSNDKGWATLGGLYQAGGMPDRDDDRRPDTLRYWSPSRRDSIRVDWQHSGSQNFVSHGRRSLLVHEYGHRLFDMAGHLALIPFHPDHPRRCAYARMCGVPNYYDPASLTLSAHERRRMGWLDVTVLDPADGDREAVAIRDLYTTGEAVFIPLGPDAAADTLTIANRQRLGYFDREIPLPREHPAYDYLYQGLATRGLHVALSRGDPRGPYSRYAYGLLPADGHYKTLPWCSGSHEDCLGPRIYDGDFFGPAHPQLTPWTRPTSGGFASNHHLPPGAEPVWFALDRVRYLPGPDSTMQFDLVADVRRRPAFLAPDAPWPAFRMDSWMGPESDGLAFGGPAVVEPGRTLYVGADTSGTALVGLGPVRITFAGGLAMGEGARLVVGPEAEVIVERGVLGGPGAVIEVMEGSRLTLGRDVRFEGARLEGPAGRGLRRRFLPRY